MIVQLKSTKKVSVDIRDLTIQDFVFCQLNDYNKNADGYVASGNYYYEKDGMGVVIGDGFSKPISKADAAQLYQLLNLTYPANTDYNQRQDIELLAGLQYILSTEKPFGLNGTDWEPA